jgi:hypothetical protein
MLADHVLTVAELMGTARPQVLSGTLSIVPTRVERGVPSHHGRAPTRGVIRIDGLSAVQKMRGVLIRVVRTVNSGHRRLLVVAIRRPKNPDNQRRSADVLPCRKLGRSAKKKSRAATVETQTSAMNQTSAKTKFGRNPRRASGKRTCRRGYRSPLVITS